MCVEVGLKKDEFNHLLIVTRNPGWIKCDINDNHKTQQHSCKYSTIRKYKFQNNIPFAVRRIYILKFLKFNREYM